MCKIYLNAYFCSEGKKGNVDCPYFDAKKFSCKAFVTAEDPSCCNEGKCDDCTKCPKVKKVERNLGRVKCSPCDERERQSYKEPSPSPEPGPSPEAEGENEEK